jgi:hypothetical protein
MSGAEIAKTEQTQTMHPGDPPVSRQNVVIPWRSPSGFSPCWVPSSFERLLYTFGGPHNRAPLRPKTTGDPSTLAHSGPGSGLVARLGG